jgi:uncharacterized membrane protein YraQ (UPF0718 family)
MTRFFRNYYVELTGSIALIAFIYFIVNGFTWLSGILDITRDIEIFRQNHLQKFSTIFLGIFVESLPFILLGVLISSFIHVFIKEDMVWRIFPKNPILSIPLAACMGLILPICECGIVPVAKRLIQKGFPTHIAFTFLLAAPIINPVTIFSTYIAFGDSWQMVYLRLLFAAGIAISMGIIFYLLFSKTPAKLILKKSDQEHGLEEECCHDHDHHKHENHEHVTMEESRSIHALHHSIFEFINTGKYFILGATVAALFQIFIGVAAIRNIGSSDWVTVLLVMGIAFGISICSSADAFIAASFRNVLGTTPIVAFLVYGPMVDLKNISMMLGSFRPAVTWLFFFGTTVMVFASVLLFL